MTWEEMRYETDRATREGERARDRRAMLHARELELGRERPRTADRRYAERSMGWLTRVAQTAASWMA